MPTFAVVLQIPVTTELKIVAKTPEEATEKVRKIWLNLNKSSDVLLGFAPPADGQTWHIESMDVCTREAMFPGVKSLRRVKSSGKSLLKLSGERLKEFLGELAEHG